MNTKTIDGKSFAKMLSGGAALLSQHKEALNSLNVFPVADGDTGTNMLRTLEGGLTDISDISTDSIGAISQCFSRAVLLSARGNSGVILSQIFAGISEGLTDYSSVGATELAEAYRKGIVRSYSAVQKPTEGTILTVFRESTEYAASKIGDDSTIEEFFEAHIKEARRSLAQTKEILPALAEADVVDSGAAGYLCIAEGMYKSLCGEQLSYEISDKREKVTLDIDSFTRDSVLEYGYCTEFILRLMSAKVDPDTFDIERVISKLKVLGGESIVAYKQEDIVKVHVHTFNPGDVLAEMQAFGEFLSVKVENMSLGHSETEKPKEITPKINKRFSIVAVASGEGMSSLFSHLGADKIVNGGQSSNPSIEDFIEAFGECKTKDIIVLPNNKNIILAAKQAAELYKNANIHVIETKDFAQGYSALSVITPAMPDIDTVIQSAKNAAQGVISAEITKAVRDVTIGERKIKEGDYIAISNLEIVSVADDANTAVIEMLEAVDTDLCEIITVFVGKCVSADQRVELTESLKVAYDECEIVVYEGGQDVYDYLIAVE